MNLTTTWVSGKHVEHRIAPRLYAPSVINAMERAEKSGVEIRKVGKACSRVYDGNHGTVHPKNFTSSGPLFIRNSYFNNLHVTQFDHISEHDYACMRSALKGLEPGCVLVAIKGDVGRAALYTHSEERGTVNPPTAVCFAAPGVDEGYLAAQFECSFFQEQIQALANSKSTRPEVSVSEFRELTILLPDWHVQYAIGNKVRKAERLRTLASHGREHLVGWISNNARAKQLDSDKINYLDHFPASTIADSCWVNGATVSNRLDPWPHHIVPSTIRKHLLKHGQYSFLRNIANRMTPERKRVDFSDPNLPGHYVSILDVDFNGRVNWENASRCRYSGNGITLLPSDVLYSCINPQQTRVGVVCREMDGFIVGSPEFAVFSSSTSSIGHPYLLSAVLRSGWVRVQASFLTRSSSLSRRRIDEEDLENIVVPWSSEDLEGMERFAQASIMGDEEATALVNSAKNDIESIINGALDEAKLIAEGKTIENWLAVNPPP